MLADAFEMLPPERVLPTPHAQQKHAWLLGQRTRTLYSLLGIKKVVRGDVIEWHGCSKVRESCEGGMHRA